MSLIRILVVDDFKDWLRQVRLLFQSRPECQVIAEASDGSEAVQKAEELKPDLIVLDVGLPNLSGIEAARQIRQRSPNSKIIFLSQNSDLDVVRAAFDMGALGYVHKTDAGSELLPGVDAVLGGKQFLSSSLEGHRFTGTSEEKAPHRHEVLFYSDDAILLDNLTRFIAVALRAGNAAAGLFGPETAQVKSTLPVNPLNGMTAILKVATPAFMSEGQKRKSHVVAGSWCALTFACQGIRVPRLVDAHAYIAPAHGRRAASSAKLGANASPGIRVEGTGLSKSH